MAVYTIFMTDRKPYQNSALVCLNSHQNCLACCCSLAFTSIIAPVVHH